MIEYLKKVLHQEDTVLFVGAGVSTWSGLPTWPGLIEELAKYLQSRGEDPRLVQQELDRGALLQAAGYGFDKLTKPQMAEFIRKSCRLGVAIPHEIHRKLVTLGPTCFVTTNYDKLLEASFHQWLPGAGFRTVINKQLTEAAEIVGARSSHFLFKFHGDAEQSDSIILTRKQYRALQQGGELHHALRTIEILMATRPFVYIGFGLNDPDFLYVKDLLANTYQGGAREHFAIMADIGEDEKAHYKLDYGIHLVGYKTDGSGNDNKHAALLTLLDELKTQPEVITPPAGPVTIDPGFVLQLARYATGLSGIGPSVKHIPLIAYPVEKNYYPWGRYNGQPIEKLLDRLSDVFILTGLPGSGKSYALRNSAARLAMEMNKSILQDNFEPDAILIPIIADLKLYKGSIWKLLEQTLPAGVSLEFLLRHFKVKIFLDAFNEIPREYLESNQWNTDLSATLQKLGGASLVISSRTVHGLEQLSLPVFDLDAIDKEFVRERLVQSNITLQGVFEDEIYAILQRPFLFKLVFESHFNIDENTSPKKIYAILLDSINKKFQQRFETNMQLEPLLSLTAMEAIDSGQEAFDIKVLSDYLFVELNAGGARPFSPQDIINWLVSQDFLIPLPGGKICFFHQSVTEYLAATRLAKIFVDDPSVLKEKLRYMRWDQALLLVTSFLQEKMAEQFLLEIVRIDFSLALSAVKYLESDNDRRLITERLLLEGLGSEERMDTYAWMMRSHLPLEPYHIPTLRDLVRRGGAAGGFAFTLLTDISGETLKQEGFDLLLENCRDGDLCSQAAEGLKDYITPDDLPAVKAMADRIQQKLSEGVGEMEDYKEFAHALARMVEELDPTLVAATLYRPGRPLADQQVHLTVLDCMLITKAPRMGFKIAADLLLAGYEGAFVLMYSLITNYRNKSGNPDYSAFTEEHWQILAGRLEHKHGTWDYVHLAIDIIKDACTVRKDIVPYFSARAEKSKGLCRVAYSYCISQEDISKAYFDVLDEMVKNPRALQTRSIVYLSCIKEINWQGHEALLVQLMKEGNKHLVYRVCNSIIGSRHIFPLTFELGPAVWWLDKFAQIDRSKDRNYYVCIPSLIMRHCPKETKKEFLDEFNRPGSPYRHVLVEYVLHQIHGFTSDDLSEEAILYLLDRKDVRTFHKHGWILRNIATDRFATERLLPLLNSASGYYLKELQFTLEDIGRRYRRRYI